MARTKENEYAEVGKQFQEAADRLRLTQMRAAKLAGISRRHLVWAFHGGNVTLSVVIRMMETLQMTELSLGGARTLTAPVSETPSAALLLISDHLEKSMREIAEVVATLRAYATPHEKPPRSQSVGRAAALLKEVTANARKRKSAATADALKSELSTAIDKAEEVEPRPRKRRR